MPEFRQQFIHSTVKNLESLHQEISAATEFSDLFIQEIFRQIHTVKGSAQTFGFEHSSRIAHELENILSDVKNERNTLTKKLLLTSIAELNRSFVENNAENAENLIEKIKTAASAGKHSINILPELPKYILNPLSKTERDSLSAAFGNKKNIFYLEIYFALKNFRENLLQFRKILEETGEIIATFSAEKKDSKIGFRFLFAGKADSEKIKISTQNFSPEIIFEISPIRENLLEVLREITAHGKELAIKLGKQIEFEISVADISVSEDQLRIIFDTLLHLIRNAASHAIESPKERIEKGKNKTGKIEIQFSRENDELKITVSDDGKGIDAGKIKSKAVERKLISEDENLDRQKILDMIFHSGISTAENITEISGRGVGLDAVKNEIENADGIINVKDGEKTGTIFDFFLPAKNKKL